MKKKVFIGIDVSKKTFDAVVYDVKAAGVQDCQHCRFDNNGDGFASFREWAVSSRGVRRGSVVVGMEDTGIYSTDLRVFLEDAGIDYCCFNALKLGMDMGRRRGKDDRTDAYRIGRYLYQNRDTLRPSRLEGGTVLKLRELASERARLVKQAAMSKALVTDRKGRRPTAQVERAKKLIGYIEGLVKEVEQEMRATMEQDDEVRSNYGLLTSIKGVGPVNAMAVITSTDNFRAFSNARQYACYVGVAPFQYTSGTSVRGRTRTSKFANAGIKAVLSQAAKSAVVHNPELRAYFMRKTGEGKHYACVLNAVKFKLVCRMFAVIKRRLPYVADSNEYRIRIAMDDYTPARHINVS